MAEVLVSTQTISNMMLHSPTDAYHSTPSTSSHHNAVRGQQAPRSYSSHNVGVPYRGTSSAPVAPYAFQSTPHLRQDSRTLLATVGSGPPAGAGSNAPSLKRHTYAPSSSESASSSTSASNASSATGGHYTLSKDDSVLVGQRPESQFGPQALSFLTSSSTPDLALANFDSTAKPFPDRYRRTARRSDSTSNVTQAQQNLENTRYNPAHEEPQVVDSSTRRPAARESQGPSVEDAQTARQLRYRRRSVGNLEIANSPKPVAYAVTTSAPTWSQVVARGHSGPVTPVTSANASHTFSNHQRNHSGNSTSSSTSNKAHRPASARQDSYDSKTNTNASSAQPQRPRTAPGRPSRKGKGAAKPDGGNRMTSRSPLSKPVISDVEKTPSTVSSSQQLTTSQPADSAEVSQSPAVQQLRDIQDPSKGVKSRLRRAFSFGSAQELRKASVENAGRAKLQKETPSDEDVLAPEDAAIAAKQEAGGIGAGIYSGQGVVYGSTDNLSISSTASSASIMLRKMGRGMKNSTRSLKGLFRPKSITGVPAAEQAVSQPSTASAAEVSLVTVEAERERVNINLDPHEHAGGGTGFPKLERNSIDVAFVERPSSLPNAQRDSLPSRKSILGGDRERQEVLASVKKGILKRAATISTTAQAHFPVMGFLDKENEPPSIATTPEESEMEDGMERDYFIAPPRFGAISSQSLPDRQALARSISWNPKVQFHEVYTPTEYDRRGEIATCNRLTPMLAQQIKEELNSFKMEMEVHEESKPHTHFF